jgi:serine/threonine protein kinase
VKCLSSEKNGGELSSSFFESIAKMLRITILTIHRKKKSGSLEKKDLQLFEIAQNSVHKIEIIGKGFFGDVYKGFVEKDDTRETVAIKTLKEVGKESNLREEAEFLASLSSPFIVKLKGVCLNSPPYLIIMEFMEHSDLLSFIRDENKRRIRSIVEIAIEAADALLYLANNNIVHNDLAARNFLVSNDYTVKLSDFGLAIDLKNSSSYKAQMAFEPTRHMAPERFSRKLCDSSSDVYSFGVFLWELATNGKIPYQVSCGYYEPKSFPFN